LSWILSIMTILDNSAHLFFYKCLLRIYQSSIDLLAQRSHNKVINAVMSSFRPQVNVHGCFYHLTQATWRKIQTLGPPIWNVNSITLEGVSRTNNICEGWNNAVAKLVGPAHPTIWRAIDRIQKDQAHVATALLRDLHGEPPAKRVRRHTHKLQSKVRNCALTDMTTARLSQPYLRALAIV